VSNEKTKNLCPVMITGKRIFCSTNFKKDIYDYCYKWINENNLTIEINIKKSEVDFLSVVEGKGRDWSTKSAILLFTLMFELGITKCLVGTRGILSEGWDCLNLNTLIDLTTVTTYTTVNQLRGRSIRISNSDKNKIANNWDIICVAPNLEHGFNDLKRLCRKHDNFYGVCDDKEIQKGINHIEPSLYSNQEHINYSDMKRINNKMFKSIIKRQIQENFGI
jgi:hypothetical protein